jgi:hypothetical protein
MPWPGRTHRSTTPDLVSRVGLVPVPVPVMALAQRAGLVRRAQLLSGKDTLAFVDVDAQQKRVCGHREQGAPFGHTKIQGKSLLVRGLNALAATICTPATPSADPGQAARQVSDGIP